MLTGLTSIKKVSENKRQKSFIIKELKYTEK